MEHNGNPYAMPRSEQNDGLSSGEDSAPKASPMPPSYQPSVKRHRADYIAKDAEIARDTQGDKNDADQSSEAHKTGHRHEQAAHRHDSSTPLIDGKQSMGHRFVSGFIQTVTIFAVALLCTVLIKTFFIQSYYVPSGSMETTIMTGDYVMVNKLADEADDIHRGDVVVFQDPGGWLSGVQEYERGGISGAMNKVGQAIGLVPKNTGTHLVKRVIGTGGDKVTCCDDQGRLQVNGVSIAEPYIRDGVAPSDTEFEVTVPEGYLWVMGDNRSNSRDSRAHQLETGFGFVPVSNVEGRAWLIYYPISHVGLMHSGEEAFRDVPEQAPSEKQASSEKTS